VQKGSKFGICARVSDSLNIKSIPAVRVQKRLRFFFFCASEGTSDWLWSDPCNNSRALFCSASVSFDVSCGSSGVICTCSGVSCAGSEGFWPSIAGAGFICRSRLAIFSSSSLIAASCVWFSSWRIWTRNFLSTVSFSIRAFSSRILVFPSSDFRFSSRRLDASSISGFAC
jgi:hypothetical protein